jgi:uncharacterized protein YdhG (YjbR/CyaY superfamily)
MADQKFASVDDYIASFPPDVQPLLQQVRQAILAVVPAAGETISYQIPTVTLGGKAILYFAGWKHHISLYPAPRGDDAFERQLAPYRSEKSTLKFPLSKPVPYDLIGQVARLAAARIS